MTFDRFDSFILITVLKEQGGWDRECMFLLKRMALTGIMSACEKNGCFLDWNHVSV